MTSTPCPRAGSTMPAHGSDVPHANEHWRWRDGEVYGRAEPLTETAREMSVKTRNASSTGERA